MSSQQPANQNQQTPASPGSLRGLHLHPSVPPQASAGQLLTQSPMNVRQHPPVPMFFVPTYQSSPTVPSSSLPGPLPMMYSMPPGSVPPGPTYLAPYGYPVYSPPMASNEASTSSSPVTQTAEGQKTPPVQQKRSIESTESPIQSQSNKKQKRNEKVQEAIDELDVLAEKVQTLCDKYDVWYNRAAEKDQVREDLNIVHQWSMAMPVYRRMPRDKSLAVYKSRLSTDTGSAGVLNTMFNQFEEKWKSYELATAPSPSLFAEPKHWEEYQKAKPILCLRPPAAIGLPVHVLYEGFRKFRLDHSNPDLNILVGARQAAADLCESMGNRYLKEFYRSKRVDKALKPLFSKVDCQFRVEPFIGMTYGVIDRAYDIGVISEHKLECSADCHMQICRSYELYVYYMIETSDDKPEHKAYVEIGCPAFLVCVQGAQIFICGGFYDAGRVTVEPLSDSVMMLRDHTGGRQQKMERLLTALKIGHQDIMRTIQNPNPQQRKKYPAYTPRLYPTCNLYSSKTKAELHFREPLAITELGGIDRCIFLASMRDLGAQDTEGIDVLVKIPVAYGEDVHQFLQTKGLAPELLAKTDVVGLPIAYVLEHLPPQWITLFRLEKDHPRLYSNNSQKIYEALKNVVKLLKDHDFVHGDLRSNNIMINVEELRDTATVQIKLVDFDWSGKAGTALYPGARNSTLTWPGTAGGPIGSEDDTLLLESWWHDVVAKLTPN